MTAPRRVVIVGTGIAGITAAETLRSKGFDGHITVYGAEPELPYHRAALSKDLLDADLSPQGVALGDADFWANRRIKVVTGTSVVNVRPGHRSVVIDTGAEVPYDALILATGGRPPAALDAARRRRTPHPTRRRRDSVGDARSGHTHHRRRRPDRSRTGPAAVEAANGSPCWRQPTRSSATRCPRHSPTTWRICIAAAASTC